MATGRKKMAEEVCPIVDIDQNVGQIGLEGGLRSDP
jgi:hypothetical protein